MSFDETSAAILNSDAESAVVAAPIRFSFKRILRAVDVFFVCTVSTINLNLLTITASGGYRVFWLWLLAIPGFIIPQAIAVSEITHSDPGECGLSLWSGRHLGKGAGFLTSWFYWLNNIPYIPSVLLYMVSTVVFILPVRENPNPYWHWIMTLFLMWGLVALSRIGFGSGGWIKWFAYSTFLVIAGLIVMGFRYGFAQHANEVSQSAGSASLSRWGFPGLNMETIAVFGFVCMSMIGVEIGSVFGEEIKSPKAATAWAAVRSSGASLFCYLIATAALLAGTHGIPLSSSSSLMEYGQHILQGPAIRPALIMLAILICISQAGAGLCWFGAASRMLWLCANDGGLPRSWSKLHSRWGTPDRAIVAQGILCSVIVTISFLGTAAQEAYLTLIDIAVILQLLPYMAIFLGLVRHAQRQGTLRRWLLSVAGVSGTITTLCGILTAFIPSRAIANVWQYEAKLALGCAFSFCTGLYVFSQRKGGGLNTNEAC